MNNFKYAGVYANSNPNNIMDWVEIINTYFILIKNKVIRGVMIFALVIKSVILYLGSIIVNTEVKEIHFIRLIMLK